MTREGVQAGTTRAIAAELGVAQATLHYVYGAKEELYRAVIEQLTNDVMSRIRDAVPPPGTDFGVAVAELADVLWQTVVEQPGTHQLLFELHIFGLRAPSLRAALDEHQRAVDTFTREILEEAATRAGIVIAHPAEELARFFLAGFEGLVLHRLSRPDDEADRRCLDALVAAACDLAIDGTVAATPR